MKFKNKSKRISTETLALGAILTALIVVLQILAAPIRLGPFSISLVLIPIVIGAATCGVGMGSWLGFVFGVSVLISGDAASFLAVDVFGTIVTVLAKGTLAGLLSGVAYKMISVFHRYAAVIVAAIVCPVVNTGVFVIGGFTFFMDTLTEWGTSLGFDNVVAYMFLGMIGLNFLFELGFNIVLSPIIFRLLDYKKKK